MCRTRLLATLYSGVKKIYLRSKSLRLHRTIRRLTSSEYDAQAIIIDEFAHLPL